jgi:mannitol-1-phosphate 5-dehydrogenase
MDKAEKRKIVIIGAGRIGRSFIGQLFSRGGYEVVFIDCSLPLVCELNKKGRYKVVIKADRNETLWIENVRGVHSDDIEKAAEEISSASIAAVSAGQTALPSVLPLLAEGLIRRFKADPDDPLDIIIAENMRNASNYFREKLLELLPEFYPVDRLAGLIETSIGKMVPVMPPKDLEEDMLQIYAEPYNTLILDRKGFRNPIPGIEGLAPKENMKAWVDRKLFIHNLGHATTAYLGYNAYRTYIFIYEALADKTILGDVRDTMLQAADILLAEYPEEFTKPGLEEHIDDLLTRFQNRALGDTIFRVGCDLTRKLAGDDRLAGAIKLAIKHKLPFNRIIHSLVCGYHFRAVNEQGQMFPGDIQFAARYSSGIEPVLSEVCCFNNNEMRLISNMALTIDHLLR